MPLYLLDANIFAPLIKGKRSDPTARKFYKEAADGGKFILSPVPLCEVLDRLSYGTAIAQMNRFLELQKYFEYRNIIRDDWEKTASIRSEQRREGKHDNIPDILIAVQANRLDATVVTNNVKHFEGIANKLENWID